MTYRHVNDRIVTGGALPGAVLHVALPAVAVLAALLLVPVVGWQIAVVGAAVMGMLFPQTLGGWLSILCLAIGVLLSEPVLWTAMVAVLLVHVMHVLASLLPVVPWRGRVVLRVLRPTLRRLLIVQLIAQPSTLAAMLLWRDGVSGFTGAAVVGAVGITAFVIFFLWRVRHREDKV